MTSGRWQTVEERFFSKVLLPSSPDDCWIWLGKLNDGGYGRFYYQGKILRAHRFSYEYYRGEIPRELTADHICRVRKCVNPWHLDIVTRGENVLRGETLPAQNIRKTHCPKGHLLAGDNLLVEKYRKCKICHREREKERRAKKRELKQS